MSILGEVLERKCKDAECLNYENHFHHCFFQTYIKRIFDQYE